MDYHNDAENEPANSSMKYKRHYLRVTALMLFLSLLCLVFQRSELGSAWRGRKDKKRPGRFQEGSEKVRQEATVARSELTHPRGLDVRKAGTTGIPIERTDHKGLNRNGTRHVDSADKFSSPYIHSLDAGMMCLQYRDLSETVREPNAKLILYYQKRPVFPEPEGGFKGLCTRPTAGPCELTFNKNDREKAHAVVFHTSRLRYTEPPFQKMPGQIWIARGLEAPIHWFPEFRSPGWKGAYNWTMTYRPDSEVFSPVGILVRIPNPPQSDFMKIARQKTRSVAWFVSDCETLSRRELYVKEMQKYIDVDIYGECGPLKCDKKGSECDEMLSKKYRFYLAFENTFCPHYVTEKLFNKYQHHEQSLHTVPVVRGGADYRKYFPEGTYINAADFESPRELAEYLKKLGKDLDTYVSFLQRKSYYGSSRCLKLEAWCHLCDMLHDKTLTPRVYDDLGAWWDEAACLNYTDVHDFPAA